MRNAPSMMPNLVSESDNDGRADGEGMMPQHVKGVEEIETLEAPKIRRSQTLSFGGLNQPAWMVNEKEAAEAEEVGDIMDRKPSGHTPEGLGNGYPGKVDNPSDTSWQFPKESELKRTHTAPAQLYPRHLRGRQDVVCPMELQTEGAAASWPSRMSTKSMREAEKAQIREQVKQHPVCALLIARDVDTVVGKLQYYEFASGERLANSGDVGQYFGILHTGRLNVLTDDGKVVCVMEPGKSFGGSALLSEGVKRVTIVAIEDCGVWGIDGVTFRNVVAADAKKRNAEMISWMDSIRLLDSLSVNQKTRLSEVAMYTAVHEAGDIVVTEGIRHTAMSIVKSGRLKVLVGGNDDVMRVLEVGDHFGKNAALYDKTKSRCSIVADTRCELVCIGIDTMKSVLGQDVSRALDDSLILKAMENSLFFSQFSAGQKKTLLEAMEIVDRRPQELIAESLDFIIVVDGEVSKSIERDEPREPRERGNIESGRQGSKESTIDLDSDLDSHLLIERGQLAETESLLDDRESMTRRRSSRALKASRSRILYTEEDLRGLVAGPEGARCALLSQERLKAALQELGIEAGSEESVEHARKALLARKIPVFHHLTSEQIDLMAQSFIRVRLEKGATVFERGSAATDFWVVSKGEVEQLNEKGRVRIIGKNGHFGHYSLLSGDKRRHTMRVISDVAEFWQLEKESLDQTLTGDARAELMRRLQLQETHVDFEDLKPLRVIGKGSFGSVRLVEHKMLRCSHFCKAAQEQRDTLPPLRYALKRVQKRGGKVDELLARECVLLNEMDHPLILQLVRTFENDTHTYILTELLTGGELLAALDHIGRPLTHSEAQFYAGSLILVLDFLQDRRVVFRDLKPENVMLDGQGYIKLIDFGTAKKLAADSDARTFTIIGSYHFMAPEVSKGRGYGTEVDIWSLGIMIYEFVCGRLPFAADLTDFIEVRKAVQFNNLVFPETYHDVQGKYLMRGMLRKEPERRLGAKNFEDLRCHEYFRYDVPDSPRGSSPSQLYDLLLARHLDPPWMPRGECYGAIDDRDQSLRTEVIGRDW